MFKWFDRWFANKCKQAWNANNSLGSILDESDDIDRYQALLEGKSISFTIFNAEGGFVVQQWPSNNNTSQPPSRISAPNRVEIPRLTIITREQDLGQAIAHIITLEALRN